MPDFITMCLPYYNHISLTKIQVILKAFGNKRHLELNNKLN